jgi:hypothetical protein
MKCKQTCFMSDSAGFCPKITITTHFEVIHSMHSHNITYPLFIQTKCSVYLLHTFIVFLLHVSVSHSPSSERSFVPFTCIYYNSNSRTVVPFVIYNITIETIVNDFIMVSGFK